MIPGARIFDLRTSEDDDKFFMVISRRSVSEENEYEGVLKVKKIEFLDFFLTSDIRMSHDAGDPPNSVSNLMDTSVQVKLGLNYDPLTQSAIEKFPIYKDIMCENCFVIFSGAFDIIIQTEGWDIKYVKFSESIGEDATMTMRLQEDLLKNFEYEKEFFKKKKSISFWVWFIPVVLDFGVSARAKVVGHVDGLLDITQTVLASRTMGFYVEAKDGIISSAGISEKNKLEVKRPDIQCDGNLNFRASLTLRLSITFEKTVTVNFEVEPYVEFDASVFAAEFYAIVGIWYGVDFHVEMEEIKILGYHVMGPYVSDNIAILPKKHVNCSKYSWCLAMDDERNKLILSNTISKYLSDRPSKDILDIYTLSEITASSSGVETQVGVQYDTILDASNGQSHLYHVSDPPDSGTYPHDEANLALWINPKVPVVVKYCEFGASVWEDTLDLTNAMGIWFLYDTAEFEISTESSGGLDYDFMIFYWLAFSQEIEEDYYVFNGMDTGLITVKSERFMSIMMDCFYYDEVVLTVKNNGQNNIQIRGWITSSKDYESEFFFINNLPQEHFAIQGSPDAISTHDIIYGESKFRETTYDLEIHFYSNAPANDVSKFDVTISGVFYALPGVPTRIWEDPEWRFWKYEISKTDVIFCKKIEVIVNLNRQPSNPVNVKFRVFNNRFAMDFSPPSSKKPTMVFKTDEMGLNPTLNYFYVEIISLLEDYTGINELVIYEHYSLYSGMQTSIYLNSLYQDETDGKRIVYELDMSHQSSSFTIVIHYDGVDFDTCEVIPANDDWEHCSSHSALFHPSDEQFWWMQDSDWYYGFDKVMYIEIKGLYPKTCDQLINITSYAAFDVTLANSRALVFIDNEEYLLVRSSTFPYAKYTFSESYGDDFALNVHIGSLKQPRSAVPVEEITATNNEIAFYLPQQSDFMMIGLKRTTPGQEEVEIYVHVTELPPCTMSVQMNPSIKGSIIPIKTLLYEGLNVSFTLNESCSSVHKFSNLLSVEGLASSSLVELMSIVTGGPAWNELMNDYKSTLGTLLNSPNEETLQFIEISEQRNKVTLIMHPKGDLTVSDFDEKVLVATSLSSITSGNSVFQTGDDRYHIEGVTNFTIMMKLCPHDCFEASGHGQCVGIDCICSDLWYGEDCGLPKCNGEEGDERCDHGTCSEGHLCICSYGWQGDFCEQPICEQTCVHGNCTRPHTCTCEVGWGNNNCSQAECDCIHGPCVAPWTCGLCNAGWTGTKCEIPVCDIPCVHGNCSVPNACHCVDRWVGDQCQTPTCFPVCVNGVCDAPQYCNCSEGYGGKICSTPVCDPSCVNGECISPNTCRCDGGWDGSTCSAPICAQGCEHGTCGHPNVCECGQGWVGSSCKVPICDDECPGIHSHCVRPNECECDPGWSGVECNDRLCTHVVCEPHGFCSSPETCTCYEEYAGVNCSEPICNGRHGEEGCSNGFHGICAPVEGMLENYCKCTQKFTGSDCEIPICYGKIGNYSCGGSARGICMDMGGEVENVCSCVDDKKYTGVECSEPVCTDQNDIRIDCENGGRCDAENNTCLCPADFEGLRCEKKKKDHSLSGPLQSILIGSIVGISVSACVIILILSLIILIIVIKYCHGLKKNAKQEEGKEKYLKLDEDAEKI